MEHYFNFPLSLLQSIRNDTDKDGLLNIIMFSTMNFSEQISFKKEAVAKQILYLNYRLPSFLTGEVRNYLVSMCNEGRLEYDEDYNGFRGDTFNPEPEMEGLLPEFDSNESFYEKCTRIYKEHQAFSLLNVNPELITHFRDNFNHVQKKLEEFELKYGPDAWTSVSNKLIFDCYKGTILMDYFRLVSSVKSVIGKRNYNGTYKSVLICRMFGCKNNTILNQFIIRNPELKGQHDLLTRRRQWEKLINTAMEKKYITHYCTGRKFFVSITMTEDELGNVIRQRKDNNTELRISND
jgi:hypothetical protein